MGGDATFSGTTYQAGVIAFISVHILTETKLRWLSTGDDTPSAVSGEVKGPGDDARIEFASGDSPIEVQAKHGLKGQKALQDLFGTIRNASSAQDSQVMLAVDSTSSASVRTDLRRDLERLRSGRSDALKDTTRTLLSALGDAILPVFRRVRIVTVDVDTLSDRETVKAQEVLAENLEDPTQAVAAWALLQADAGRMCADKSRRTRKDLIDLLSAAGIRLRPPRRTRRWHDDLRFSKKLLGEDDPAAVLSLLRQIELDLKSGTPDGEILYRLNQHKAAAYLQLGQYKQAVIYAQKALDHDATGIHALVNLANALALDGQADAARTVAEKAISLHPQAATAWLVRLQVAFLAGDKPISETPPDVASTLEYRRGLIQINLFAGDASRARDLAAEVIAEGDRSPQVLLLRVDALLSDIDAASVEDRLSRAAEVERLCTEILDGSSDLGDVRAQRALVGRSVATRILGRIEDSQADIERAHEIRPDDARILIETAQARIQAGDVEGALALLSRPIVEETAFLLAIPRHRLEFTCGSRARIAPARCLNFGGAGTLSIREQRRERSCSILAASRISPKSRTKIAEASIRGPCWTCNRERVPPPPKAAQRNVRRRETVPAAFRKMAAGTCPAASKIPPRIGSNLEDF